MHCQTSVKRLNLLIVLFYSLAVSLSSQHLVPSDSQQIYELINKVVVNDLKRSSSQEASYVFRAKLKVNSVWNSQDEQLLQVYFEEPSVSAPAKGPKKYITQKITKIPDRPFYVKLVEGKPTNVIAHTSRDQSLLNFERSIASLLQVKHNEGLVSELDVLGQCTVVYHIKSTTEISKTKTDCSHWDLRVNYRPEKPLGVFQHSIEQVTINLATDGALLKVESTETHNIGLEANREVGTQIISQLFLEHLETGELENKFEFKTVGEAVESLLEWYRVFDIEADVDGAISELKGQSLKEEIAAKADQLTDKHIGKSSMALTFAELLPLARITKQQEFVEILYANKALHAQLVDLLGAVQTIDSHNAVHEVFQYENESHAELLEKYLKALSVGTHPDRAIIEDLWKILQNREKPIKSELVKDSLLQTLTALIKHIGADPNDQFVNDIRSHLLTQLVEVCKDVACKTLYIRALENLQDTSTIPTLVSMALNKEAKVSVAAMQALRRFPIFNFNESHRDIFTQIFYQNKGKFDSSARNLALDMLFALKLTKEQLGHLLDYLASNDRQYEVKTYVIQRLRLQASKCPRFKVLLHSCLAERPKVNNYNTIAQKGLTTVLLRELSVAPAFNESLLSIQEINKGLLKRGSVEMILKAGDEEVNSFKLGIFTSGLGSFVRSQEDEDDSDNDADEGPATAGMEISVQGVLLRPLIFFTGQTELMGHIWSGTVSHPTPAFQATVLAHDHEHYVILSSGATIYTRVVGTKSIDLNGKAKLSIWNRNANTEIQQNTAEAISGVTIVGFTYARVQNQFTLLNEPKITLQADLDFYSGIKLCMQLQRPEMQLRHLNTKTVNLQGAKSYAKKITTEFLHKFPGRTLALNQKNNEMCNMILQ